MSLNELINDPDPNWLTVSLFFLAIVVVIFCILAFGIGVATIFSHLRWE